MFAATGECKESQPSTSFSIERPQPCRHFEFHEILSATDNFDESLIIGHGGFGKVYKGNITNGSRLLVAAIKRLDSMSSQGPTEFWAEVEMLSKLSHCHLVSLFGYCIYQKEMILIYEYMPNGTLADHLHKLGTPMSWIQRLKICIGAARGLHYLHTGTGIEVGVIHRDVKTSNILLHESWAAKISDFGLSKIGRTNQPSTYVNTLVKGTFGYLDPDYFFTGRLTRKSDVYAFGVVLLEVLCRKRAVDESLDEEQWNLARWALESIKAGNLKRITDSGIRGEIYPKCLKEFILLAERCLHSNPKQRPTMAEVVVTLESVLTLQEKKNSTLQHENKTIFGRMADKLTFPSKRNNSERCLHSTPEQQYPTFAEVVVSLQSALTLQEKLLSSLPPARKPIYCTTDDKFPFPSNNNNSAHVDSNLSSNGKANSRNAAADTVADIVAADNKVFRPPIPGLRVYRFADFKRATRNFGLVSCSGAFASVHIGWVDKETFTPSTQEVGIAVAIKHYPKAHPKWQRDVTRLAPLAHPNIIGLLGYCNDDEKCWLVYKHTKNPTFAQLLFADTNKDVSKPLSWRTRLRIIIGVARGLAYIHSSKDQVVHGDVNTSNISVDEDFKAKLGVFGLSTFVAVPPYLDLKYSMTCKLDLKCEIFSFGVVLLETLTGRKAFKHYGESGMGSWASQFLFKRNCLKEIMDPRLEQNYPLEDASKCFALALRCVAMNSVVDRPTSEAVLRSLEQIYDGNK